MILLDIVSMVISLIALLVSIIVFYKNFKLTHNINRDKLLLNRPMIHFDFETKKFDSKNIIDAKYNSLSNQWFANYKLTNDGNLAVEDWRILSYYYHNNKI